MRGHALATFRRTLDQIDGYRKYLSAAARIADTFSPNDDESTVALQRSITRGLRKRLDYSSIVVSLYGAIEEFIETICEEVAAEFNRAVDSYKDLPATFRKTHERLTVRLLEQVTRPGYSGDLQMRRVTANLDGCLSGRSDYRLNVEAYALHSTNMRRGTIHEMLAAVGVALSDVLISQDNIYGGISRQHWTSRSKPMVLC